MNYIAEFMKKKEVEAEVVGESIYDVTEVAEDISAIVAIGQPQFTTDLPIIDGTPLLRNSTWIHAASNCLKSSNVATLIV